MIKYQNISNRNVFAVVLMIVLSMAYSSCSNDYEKGYKEGKEYGEKKIYSLYEEDLSKYGEEEAKEYAEGYVRRVDLIEVVAYNKYQAMYGHPEEDDKFAAGFLQGYIDGEFKAATKITGKKFKYQGKSSTDGGGLGFFGWIIVLIVALLIYYGIPSLFGSKEVEKRPEGGSSVRPTGDNITTQPTIEGNIDSPTIASDKANGPDALELPNKAPDTTSNPSVQTTQLFKPRGLMVACVVGLFAMGEVSSRYECYANTWSYYYLSCISLLGCLAALGSITEWREYMGKKPASTVALVFACIFIGFYVLRIIVGFIQLITS